MSKETMQKRLDMFSHINKISPLEILFASLAEQDNIKFEPQYYDDLRYPYFCDFYLPDFDMFIEINAYWTHGPHLFNKDNSDDIKLLNYWKEKNTQNYNYAIHVLFGQKKILKKSIVLKIID